MPNSFHWRQELFGSISEYKYATNCDFKKSSCNGSFYYIGSVFTNMPNCFSESHFCGTKSENKVDFSFWKERFSSEGSSANVECNFNNAAEKLDQNSKAFRSFSENNFINNQFSQKKNISWENFSSQIGCMFGSLAEKNFLKNVKSFLFEKIDRIKTYWGIFFLERFPWTRRKQKWHSC